MLVATVIVTIGHIRCYGDCYIGLKFEVQLPPGDCDCEEIDGYIQL